MTSTEFENEFPWIAGLQAPDAVCSGGPLFAADGTPVVTSTYVDHKSYHTTADQVIGLVRPFEKAKPSGIAIKLVVNGVYHLTIDINQIEQQGLGESCAVFRCPLATCGKAFARRHCIARHVKNGHKAQHAADADWWWSHPTLASYSWGSKKTEYKRRPRAEIEKEKAENGGFLRARAPARLLNKRKREEQEDREEEEEAGLEHQAPAKPTRKDSWLAESQKPQVSTSNKRGFGETSDQDKQDAVFPAGRDERALKRLKPDQGPEPQPAKVARQPQDKRSHQIQRMSTQAHSRPAATIPMQQAIPTASSSPPQPHGGLARWMTIAESLDLGMSQQEAARMAENWLHKVEADLRRDADGCLFFGRAYRASPEDTYINGVNIGPTNASLGEPYWGCREASSWQA